MGVFVASGQHSDAIKLAALMLPAAKGPEADIKSYHREQLLKELSAVPDAEFLPYIKLLVRAIETAISLERPEDRDDGSLMWRPAIEDHEPNWRHGDEKDQLVTALRDELDRYIGYLRNTGQPNIASILHDVLAWDSSYSLLVRLKLHFYRQCG